MELVTIIVCGWPGGGKFCISWGEKPRDLLLRRKSAPPATSPPLGGYWPSPQCGYEQGASTVCAGSGLAGVPWSQIPMSLCILLPVLSPGGIWGKSPTPGEGTVISLATPIQVCLTVSEFMPKACASFISLPRTLRWSRPADQTGFLMAGLIDQDSAVLSLQYTKVTLLQKQSMGC